VTVRDGSRIVATVPVEPGGIYVIPGGSAIVRATWHGTPELGEVTAVASVHVKVSGVPSGTFMSNTLRLSFFSWRLLIVILLALLAIMLALLAALLVRRRREACSHCGTKYRQSRLAEVSEKAEVAMCPDCMRTVDTAGRAVLCTNCLKEHLLEAARTIQTRRPARPHGRPASGPDRSRARAGPRKQRKTAPKTSAARAQAEPPKHRKTAAKAVATLAAEPPKTKPVAKSPAARAAPEPPKRRKTVTKSPSVRAPGPKAAG
jgi:hypothetical protein